MNVRMMGQRRAPGARHGGEPDAAAYDAALTVFCDFETRNTGGM